ncbi:MAG: zinc ABC transporter substrate-binding protein [Thiothrix sp.]|nr:zinc ABC transporter substrate-binding protein [Thiothrix sp.]HPQ97710.1 zinc ABC transporter substrate-binding protein [Thiolinea sp.]
MGLIFRLLLGMSLWLGAGLSVLAQERPLVFVSVVPQQYFVERIAGGLVEVQAMVQPGFSPHTYEPTPRQISQLARADLYIRIGVPFEDSWMRRIQGVNPDMPVLDARTGLKLLPMAEQEGGDEHGHRHENQFDPHVWTSPRLVEQMSEPMLDALAKLLPQHKVVLEQNRQQFVAELQALDQALARQFAAAPGKRFMVFHPSWGYLADAYGLTQVAIEADGKEPGARALAQLIDTARAEGIKSIFVQPQFDRRMAEQVAEAIGGRVEAIDPLEYAYFDMMHKAANLIAGTVP